MALATHPIRTLVALACATLIACAAAAPADAAYTVTVDGGTLTLTGDGSGEELELQLEPRAPGTLNVFVRRQKVAAVSRSQFTHIIVRAGGGGDRVEVDELHGSFMHQEQTSIEGEGGDDILAGGAGVQIIDGGPGNDQIEGDGAFGGSGLDGPDDLRGGPGDDRFEWGVSDGGDHFDGGADTDSVRAIGGTDGETFRLGQNESRLAVTRTSPGPQSPGESTFEVTTATEKLQLEPRNGNDTIAVGPEAPSGVALALLGGRGTDTVTGGGAGETISGGDDPDVLSGGGGDDTITGDLGDDELRGDAGVDTLDGGAGIDRLFCGGFGDRLVVEEGVDVVADDCRARVEPQPEPQPQPQPAPQPEPQPVDPGTGVQPVAAFAKPKVRGTLKALTVSIRNTGGTALELRVGATEKAGGRSFRYAKRTVRIAPGASARVTLRTPTTLRRLLTRAAARRSVVRRPTITVADRAGAAKATVRARVALKRVR